MATGLVGIQQGRRATKPQEQVIDGGGARLSSTHERIRLSPVRDAQWTGSGTPGAHVVVCRGRRKNRLRPTHSVRRS